MVMLKQKTVVLAKLETTYGSDPTPAAANAIDISDASLKEIKTPVERNIMTSTLSRAPSVGAEQFCEISFKTEVKGSGTAGTPPRLDPLFRACGWARTSISTTSVTYKPSSANHESATLYYQQDGAQNIITGCRGNSKLTATAGKFAELEFALKGLFGARTVTAMTTPTLEGTLPPVCKASQFAYNSKTTLVVAKVEIDMQNVVVMRPSISGTYALAGFEITGRNPILSMDPEAQIQTSYTFRDDQLTTQRAVSFVIGATAGNICTITVPKFNITEIEYGDRDGILIETVKGEMCKDSADDEISVVFT
jgi:hypothetical protein